MPKFLKISSKSPSLDRHGNQKDERICFSPSAVGQLPMQPVVTCFLVGAGAADTVLGLAAPLEEPPDTGPHHMPLAAATSWLRLDMLALPLPSSFIEICRLGSCPTQAIQSPCLGSNVIFSLIPCPDHHKCVGRWVSNQQAPDNRRRAKHLITV
jgi:hypothetical protein